MFLNGSLGITWQAKASGTHRIRDPQGALISMGNSADASFDYTTDALGSTILLTDKRARQRLLISQCGLWYVGEDGRSVH